MNDHRAAPIEALLGEYQRAVRDRDLEGFMAIFSDDVRVFDAWGRWTYEGAPAFRKMIAAWLSSHRDERFEVRVQELRTLAGEEVAVATAIMRYASVAADGRELRSLENRLTWGLRREGSGWKVVHEHTSVPVGFENHQAIMQREPG